MIEIKNTIQEIIEAEAEAERIVASAVAKANELKQAVEIEIESATKELVASGKKEASELLKEGKLSSEAKANAFVQNGIKEAELMKSEARENIPEVSDYIIHKLKVSYGDR